MQQSTISYRSNRYATQSRKLVPSFNPSSYQAPSPSASLLQQQQIQQLQQKVDMILLHNNQLLQENAQLKHKLELFSIREADSRYNLDGNMTQVYRLRIKLQTKCQQLDELNRKRALQNSGIYTQFQQLNLVIKQLQLNHEKTLLQNQQLTNKYQKLYKQHNTQISNLRQQLQNQIYQNSLKKQIEHKQQIRQKQHELNEILNKKIQQWQQQKVQLEQKKLNMIIDLEDKMKKQKQDQIKKIQEDYQIKLKRLQEQAEERCRKNREQSQNYIKSMLQQFKYEEKPEQQLKDQIQNLKQALESRQKTIQNLLKFQTKSSSGTNSYYNQVQQLRARIKQLTEDFFKQSELLKVKMAVKHDIDVRQTIRVYDNKIDVLTAHINILQEDKFRLRQKYQDQIRSKIKQRQRFQIQVSKLKNYIRKMKIQLQSYGKQMRLNIQGIRDQANSFSMSILGELGQQKNKKTFYQEQIRKMRQVINLKDHEIEVITKQCEQKIKYYDQKLKVAKQTIDDLSEQLQGKDERFTEQIQNLRENARQQLKRQKNYWEQMTSQHNKQINDLHKQVQNLDFKYKQTLALNSSLEKDIQKLTHQLQSCKSHIDSLQIQLQMAHEPPNIPDNKVLKQHYQRIIEVIQNDKQILKQTNSKQAQQMAKLIAKYKILEKSVQKTLSTMKKRTDLDQRVLEVGLDSNLVKNLAEVFKIQQNSGSMRQSRQILSASKENL